MGARVLTDEVLLKHLLLLREHGDDCSVARATGDPRPTIQARTQAVRVRWPNVLPPSSSKPGWAKSAGKPRISVPAAKPAITPEPYVAPESEDEFAEWRLNGPPQAAFLLGDAKEFRTNTDNTFLFGALGDSHLASKYERLDVLNRLFDAFAEEGIKTVFHTGNWIDGEAKFNVHDLHTRGLDGQCRYLAKVWPQRPGMTTYAVTGDDHEGWYAQREGIDIGRYAERCFRDVGREDWHDLGYMEAPVKIVNANSGALSVLSVVHPGGGSSYALSYAIQKIIESLDGGEKPAIGLYGHYHKLWAGNIRNVWCVQTGTTQDQTPFMRKKKLEAHVGGFIVKVTQDPETGAIVRCRTEMLRYFNRGYYGSRWSHHGPVNLLPRVESGLTA